MRDLITLFVHVITTVLRVGRPGGVRTVIAESVLTKHQLLILNRSRRQVQGQLRYKNYLQNVARNMNGDARAALGELANRG